MTTTISNKDLFKQLTWDDLQAWAGTRIVSRGQSYQRNRQVDGLTQTRNGGLVAWVHGEKKYATLVGFEDNQLISACTCPYGTTCKHAVAVVLEYLDRLKKNVEVPFISKKDERLELLEDFQDEEPWEDENGEIHEEDVDDEEEMVVTRNHASKGDGKTSPLSLMGYLEGQTKEELINLVKDLAGKYPTVQEDLQHRRDLSKGSVNKIVAAVKKEIHELSSEPAWRNHWNNEGYIPDYSRVKDRLESLLKNGHPDEVVALGKELLEAGTRQVEMSNDGGETGMEISSCLQVVFQAIPQSSLSPVDQMLWVIEKRSLIEILDRLKSRPIIKEK